MIETDGDADAEHQRNDPCGRIRVGIDEDGAADDSQRDDRADGQIEAAGGNDVDLSGGENRERRGPFEEIHVAGRLKKMRRLDRDRRDEQRQHDVNRIEREAARGQACRGRRREIAHATILFERTA